MINVILFVKKQNVVGARIARELISISNYYVICETNGNSDGGPTNQTRYDAFLAVIIYG